MRISLAIISPEGEKTDLDGVAQINRDIKKVEHSRKLDAAEIY